MKIDRGIALLYDGGLALGELTFSTGLAQAMGEGITTVLPAHSTLALTIRFTGAAIAVSEAASNTAPANMVIPIAIAVSQAAGVRAIEPVLGATPGASMGFMMPVSTAPNAIVYSSGFVPIGTLMRHGLLLDIVAFFVMVATVMLPGPARLCPVLVARSSPIGNRRCCSGRSRRYGLTSPSSSRWTSGNTRDRRRCLRRSRHAWIRRSRFRSRGRNRRFVGPHV